MSKIDLANWLIDGVEDAPTRGDLSVWAIREAIKKYDDDTDSCTITNHVITNDGQACECGYLIKAEI